MIAIVLVVLCLSLVESLLPDISLRSFDSFKSTWKGRGVRTSGLKYAEFPWPCGTIPGLRLEEARIESASPLIQLPILECLAVRDLGSGKEDGVPEALYPL